MGSFSIWHWLAVIAVVVVVFGGRGKLSSIMGDLAKGIKEFKHGMKDDDTHASTAAPTAPLARTEAERARDEARS